MGLDDRGLRIQPPPAFGDDTVWGVFFVSLELFEGMSKSLIYSLLGGTLLPQHSPGDAPKRARKIPLVEIQIAGFLELFSYNIYKHIRVYRKKKKKIKITNA